MSYISLLFLLLHIMLSHSFYFRSVLLISNILLVIFFLVVVVPFKKIALLLKEVPRSLQKQTGIKC